ncbi:MAG TPA: winged helix-turn-helix domain-containing protein [Candidatus Bathyarchaeia archaeon]|nr:winged helix-turn-helix domain-containing protein [Candidatus Bathyarchaeia archaeon]
MKSSQPFLFPLPRETMEKFVRLLFGPIEKGESLVLILKAKAGRRALPKFFIDNALLFKDQIRNDPGNYFFYYIDPPEMSEETPLGYLLLLYQALKPDSTLVPGSYFEILNLVKQAIKKKLQAREIVFFLNQIDELPFTDKTLFNNLKTLWQIDKRKIHFVFLPWDDISQPPLISDYGELAEAIMENLVEIPSLTPADISYVIKRQAYFLQTKFNQQQVETIKKVSQANPYLIKVAARLLAHNPDIKTPEVFLNNHYQIKLLKNESQRKINPLTVDPQSGVILQGKRPIDLSLTGKEYDILVFFLTHKNFPISRDKIAEVLWGKDSYEKYSDWAIDQLIHQLRNKLALVGVKENLVTVKGKGYCFKASF